MIYIQKKGNFPKIKKFKLSKYPYINSLQILIIWATGCYCITTPCRYNCLETWNGGLTIHYQNQAHRDDLDLFLMQLDNIFGRQPNQVTVTYEGCNLANYSSWHNFFICRPLIRESAPAYTKFLITA